MTPITVKTLYKSILKDKYFPILSVGSVWWYISYDVYDFKVYIHMPIVY
jgi:hypothetical protein